MKVCDECGEEIKDSMLECPNCNAWQGFQGVEFKYIFVFLLSIFLAASGLVAFFITLTSHLFTQGSIRIFCVRRLCFVTSPVTVGAFAYTFFSIIIVFAIKRRWFSKIGKNWTREEIQQAISEEDSDSWSR